MAVEEKTMRDQLSAAFDSHVEEPKVEEVKQDDKTIVGDSSVVDNNLSGTEVRKDTGALGEPKDDKPTADISPVIVDAPVSLKAAEKAEWAKAPKAIQEAFLRRESEVQTALRGSAEARKLAEEFSQTVGPFMPLIRASNSTPMVAFKNLMTTAAGLTVGTPQQKAGIIRDIIQNYGIDIKVLDEVLSNNLPAAGRQAPGTSDVEVHIQRAMAPMYEFMNSIQGQRQANQQRMEQDAEKAVEKFRSQNQFFDDLRDEVADLMEVAAGRGREMTMKEAYDIAVSMNPTIKAAVAQKNAAGNQGAAERAQRASLSVSGNPAGQQPRDPNANSLRDDLMNAWGANT